MNDRCVYTIKLLGEVTVDELNAMSPIEMTVVNAEPTSTLVSVSTDQSGLVGLLSTLHGRGFVLLAVTRAEHTGKA
jgi:hypothetical protein